MPALLPVGQNQVLSPVTEVPDDYPIQNENQGLGTSVMRGLKSSMLSTDANSAYADYFRAAAAGDKKAAKAHGLRAQILAQEAERAAPRVQSIGQINGLGDTADYVAGQFGAAPAAVAKPVAGGLAGGAAGMLYGGPAAAAIGGTVGGLAAMYPDMQNAALAEHYNALEGAEPTPEQAQQAVNHSSWQAAAQTLPYAIAPELGIGGRVFGGKAALPAATSTLGSLARGTAIQAGAGAASSEIGHQFQNDYNPNRDKSGDVNQNWDAAAGNALIGLPSEAIGHAGEVFHGAVGEAGGMAAAGAKAAGKVGMKLAGEGAAKAKEMWDNRPADVNEAAVRVGTAAADLRNKVDDVVDRFTNRGKDANVDELLKPSDKSTQAAWAADNQKKHVAASNVLEQIKADPDKFPDYVQKAAAQYEASSKMHDSYKPLADAITDWKSSRDIMGAVTDFVHATQIAAGDKLGDLHNKAEQAVSDAKDAYAVGRATRQNAQAPDDRFNKLLADAVAPSLGLRTAEARAKLAPHVSNALREYIEGGFADSTGKVAAPRSLIRMLPRDTVGIIKTAADLMHRQGLIDDATYAKRNDALKEINSHIAVNKKVASLVEDRLLPTEAAAMDRTQKRDLMDKMVAGTLSDKDSKKYFGPRSEDVTADLQNMGLLPKDKVERAEEQAVSTGVEDRPETSHSDEHVEKDEEGNGSELSEMTNAIDPNMVREDVEHHFYHPDTKEPYEVNGQRTFKDGKTVDHNKHSDDKAAGLRAKNSSVVRRQGYIDYLRELHGRAKHEDISDQLSNFTAANRDKILALSGNGDTNEKINRHWYVLREEKQGSRGDPADVQPHEFINVQANSKWGEASGGQYGTTKKGRIWLERKNANGKVTQFATSAAKIIRNMHERRGAEGRVDDSSGLAGQHTLLMQGLASLLNSDQLTGRIGLKDKPNGEIRWLGKNANLPDHMPVWKSGHTLGDARKAMREEGNEKIATDMQKHIEGLRDKIDKAESGSYRESSLRQRLEEAVSAFEDNDHERMNDILKGADRRRTEYASRDDTDNGVGADPFETKRVESKQYITRDAKGNLFGSKKAAQAHVASLDEQGVTYRVMKAFDSPLTKSDSQPARTGNRAKDHWVIERSRVEDKRVKGDLPQENMEGVKGPRSTFEDTKDDKPRTHNDYAAGGEKLHPSKAIEDDAAKIRNRWAEIDAAKKGDLGAERADKVQGTFDEKQSAEVKAKNAQKAVTQSEYVLGMLRKGIPNFMSSLNKMSHEIRVGIAGRLAQMARADAKDPMWGGNPPKDMAAFKATAERVLQRLEKYLSETDDKGKPIVTPKETRQNAQSTTIHDELGREGFAATHDSPKWHAGEFDWRTHIGSGEGNAAYGAGLYLSTANGVHGHYKRMFTSEVSRGNSKVGDWQYKLNNLKNLKKYYENLKSQDEATVHTLNTLADRLNGYEQNMKDFPHVVEHISLEDGPYGNIDHVRKDYTYHASREDAELAAAFTSNDHAEVIDSKEDPRRLGPWVEAQQRTHDTKEYWLRNSTVGNSDYDTTVERDLHSGRYYFREYMGESNTEGPLPNALEKPDGFASLEEATEALRAAYAAQKRQAESALKADNYAADIAHQQKLIDEHMANKPKGKFMEGEKSPTYQVSVNIRGDQLLDWNRPIGEQSNLLDALGLDGVEGQSTGRSWVKNVLGRDQHMQHVNDLTLVLEDDAMRHGLSESTALNLVNRLSTEWLKAATTEEYRGDHNALAYKKFDDLKPISEDLLDEIKPVSKSVYGFLQEYNDALDGVAGKSRTPVDAVAAMLQKKVGERTQGGDLYNMLTNQLGSQRAASEYLQSHGILGHTYDPGGFGGGVGGKYRNHVIYDDSKVTTNYVHFSAQDPKNKAFGSDPRPPASDAERAKFFADVARRLGPDMQAALEEHLYGKTRNGKKIEISGEWSQGLIKASVYSRDLSQVGAHEAFHEFFNRLKDQPQAAKVLDILSKAADTAYVQRQLERLLDGERAALNQIKKGAPNYMEERMAYMFQFHQAGLLKIGPETEGTFAKIARVFRKIVGMLSNDQKADAILRAFDKGQMKDADAAARVLSKNIELRENMYKAVDKALKPALDKLGRIVNTAETNLKQSGPEYVEVRRMFKRSVGEDGQQGFLDAKDHQMKQKSNLVMNAFRDAKGDPLPEGDIALAAPYLHSGERPTDPVVMRIVAQIKGGKVDGKQVEGILPMMHKYLQDAGVKRWEAAPDGSGRGEWVPMGKIKDGYFPRVLDTAMMNMKADEFAADLLKHNGDELQKIADSYNATSSKVMGEKPEEPKTAADVAKALTTRMINSAGQADLGENTSAVGFSPFMRAVNQRQMHWLHPEILKKWGEKDVARVMTSYVAQAVKRAEYVRRFGNGGEVLKEKLEQAHNNGLARAVEDKFGIKNALSKANGTPDSVAEGITNKMWSVIVKENPKADRKEFDKLTTQQLKIAKGAATDVMAMEGTLGYNIGSKWRTFQNSAMVYENMRVLSTSLFSQFIDPLGLMVRGGTMGEAWDAYKRGMREVVASIKGEHIKDLDQQIADQVGTTDAGGMLAAYGQLYSSQYMGASFRKANDALFKYNGMEGFNRGMQVAGTRTAINFIIRHAMEPNDRSERYLKELNLTAADVKRSMKNSAIQDGKNLDYTDPKIQEAIHQWVNGSIMRPNAAQRPAWGSDPHYMMFWHMKQFAYTFHDVILKRAQYEAKEFNDMGAAGILAAGYTPMMIASDAMKSILLTGSEPAWMKAGLASEIEHGAMRAGLLGKFQPLADVALTPGRSILGLGGPVVEQIAQLAEQTPTDAAVNAAPGANLLNMWRGHHAVEVQGED